MAELIYSFNEGNKNMIAQLGGKGANLSEMTKIGLPVPFGFILDSSLCNDEDWENGEFPEYLVNQIEGKLEELAAVSGKRFGDIKNPLFLSVRSSGMISMPGMMQTVLNLGLNDKTAAALAVVGKSVRFAYYTYRKFILDYSQIVLGLNIDSLNYEEFGENDNTRKIKKHIHWLKKQILSSTGKEFPQEVSAQLYSAIRAVFRSWNLPRAKNYRKFNSISDNLGTAVIVQQMVFGNMDSNSGAGVVFSKNPTNGEDEVYGEFANKIQGDAIASGKALPDNIGDMRNLNPGLYEKIAKIANLLEEHFKWVQDIEFTFEQNKIYILQSKNAKMSINATVKNSVRMAKKGYFDKHEALIKIPQSQLGNLLSSCNALDLCEESESEDLIAAGKSASVSVATGRLCIFEESAKAMMRQGEKVVFVCERANPSLFPMLEIADGMVAATGAVTSHMAILARSFDKPFLIISENLTIDYKNALIKIGETSIKEGEILTIDSASGRLFRGKKAKKLENADSEFADILSWADESRTLKVRANISSTQDAENAMKFGCEGIGLCRTEHIFDEIHINDILTLLLSDMEIERRVATEKLIVVQKNFFKRIFAIIGEKPITIRLMDPILNNWLPKTDTEIEKTADRLSISVANLKKKLANIVEINPLLGYRGCRITVKYPEITTMQAMAIALAVSEMRIEQGMNIEPEIMVPLVGISKEFQFVKTLIDDAMAHCMQGLGTQMNYTVGTMIEVPRATLIAGEIAKNADFFSFGTNDLTQFAFGISKENVEILMNKYNESGILTKNPFETLDIEGVGSIISIAVKNAKAAKAKIKLGVCGNQSSDPASIGFYHKLGLNYISCEPEKVPEARIAAAQAKISENLI
ncbi:MAG: pyruvate, phosphate dikinase [Eubacteriales bacterium]